MKRPVHRTAAIRVALYLAIAITAGSRAYASSYSAVSGISSSNPSGVWSYGYEGTLGGTFNLFTVYTPASANNTHDLEAWSYATNYPDATATPYIGHNTLTTTDTFFNLPPDLLQLHPGQASSSESYAVLRWTSPFPVATLISVTGLYSTVFNPNSTTDVHILVNGADLSSYDYVFTGTGANDPFSLSLLLAPGSTIDFVTGPHGDYNGDSTGLSVAISNVPEPATAGCIVGGLLIFGLLRRRRAL